MQYPKDDVRRKLLEAAARIFARKGYLKASMRDIAAESGVGLSNIYNYYDSKDELFRHVVSPAVQVLERLLDEHHGRCGTDIMAMCSPDYCERVVGEYVGFIDCQRRPLALLLFRAQGSSLENFREEFADRATRLVEQYFADMKRRHPQIAADVSGFSIRMHTVWMFALLEEVVKRDVGPDELKQIVSEYVTIEMAGWRELMKL